MTRAIATLLVVSLADCRSTISALSVFITVALATAPNNLDPRIGSGPAVHGVARSPIADFKS